jgi:UDP-2,4-diacetamido-2,4,6-trideoxy-beta-L-altropyranose hydrolase
VLVTFGGVDAADDTSKAITALLVAGGDLEVDVIVPHASPHKAALFERFGAEARVTLRENVEHMAQLMDAADLAVGAGGATTWERCYLGLPTITLVVAENQVQANADLATTGIIRNLGWHQQVSPQVLAKTIQDLVARPDELVDMSNKALALMTQVAGNEPAIVEMLRKHS